MIPVTTVCGCGPGGASSSVIVTIPAACSTSGNGTVTPFVTSSLPKFTGAANVNGLNAAEGALAVLGVVAAGMVVF